MQTWLTEQTNRTEHFRGRVRFVRVRRHIEQNRTVPLFSSCSPGSRTLIPLFGSVRIELEPNSTLVRFVFGKFGLFKALKAKSTTLYMYFLGVGLIPGLGSHIINNSRRTEEGQRNNGRKNNGLKNNGRKKVHKYSRGAAGQTMKNSALRTRSRIPSSFS